MTNSRSDKDESRKRAMEFFSEIRDQFVIGPAPEGYRLANEELLREIASGAVAVSARHPVRGQPRAPKP